MLTIEIHDERFAHQLQEIAERENRPIEDVLKSMAAQYPAEASSAAPETAKIVHPIRRKAFAKARLYWQSVGDTAKAAMTDEELDEQFGAFDEEGIPRLKSELKSAEPPVGSLAYAAKVIREGGGIKTGGILDVTKLDDILNDEFPDYLHKRMSGDDASQ